MTSTFEHATTPPSEWDADRFCDWLASALPGDRIEYHRGFLSMDRTAATRRLPEPSRRHLEQLAGVVLEFAQNRRVHLIQRRLGDDQYSYIAVKTGARP